MDAQLREAKLCGRSIIYEFGECDLLFVSLKKFGIGLLACGFLPAASPTLHRVDDLSPA